MLAVLVEKLRMLVLGPGLVIGLGTEEHRFPVPGLALGSIGIDIDMLGLGQSS